MRTPLLMCLTASLLACQSPPPSAGDAGAGAATAGASAGTDGSNPTKPAQANTCEAAPLATELQSYCAFDLGVPPLPLPKVEFTDETYHPLATRVITLDSRGIQDPEGGAEPVTIQEWLADPPRRLPEPGEMTLAIAADVPATTVAELQRGLSAAGRREVRILVHAGGDAEPVPQPRDPDMLAKVGEQLPSDANQKVVFVAQAVQGYAEVCPPIAGVFTPLSQVSPGDRCTKLGELAAAAIVECGCTQLPSIMTLLYALTVGFEVPPGRAIAVPVHLDPQAKLVPAEGATWGDVAGEKFRSTELHRLWIDAVAPPATFGREPAPAPDEAPPAEPG